MLSPSGSAQLGKTALKGLALGLGQELRRLKRRYKKIPAKRKPRIASLIDSLRWRARHVHLARAFVQGQPYAQVEPKATHPPIPYRIADLAMFLGRVRIEHGVGDIAERAFFIQDVTNWLKGTAD